ncbi:uncharacterized protein UTRI_02574 [Ustilago trichophora]|uniref:Uncharacterized protein n=1 Tax=Ustilago trichophora TaxID=86804 RepID=A0A5C3E745_9BASI|nr:uncharacterized protein UTRI_02574 [Ustilago trichophora]
MTNLSGPGPGSSNLPSPPSNLTSLTTSLPHPHSSLSNLTNLTTSLPHPPTNLLHPLPKLIFPIGMLGGGLYLESVVHLGCQYFDSELEELLSLMGGSPNPTSS